MVLQRKPAFTAKAQRGFGSDDLSTQKKPDTPRCRQPAGVEIAPAVAAPGPCVSPPACVGRSNSRHLSGAAGKPHWRGVIAEPVRTQSNRGHRLQLLPFRG